MNLLDEIKLALRIVTNAFDAELLGLIAAAQLDLGVAVCRFPPRLTLW